MCAAVPEEEAFQEFSVLSDAALSPKVGEIKHHPVKNATLEGGTLPQIPAVHLEEHGST